MPFGAACPYARGELHRFNAAVLSEERDHTAEEMHKAMDRRWRGKCVKPSPVISSPARLLKLLKPTMPYIRIARIDSTLFALTARLAMSYDLYLWREEPGANIEIDRFFDEFVPHSQSLAHPTPPHGGSLA